MRALLILILLGYAVPLRGETVPPVQPDEADVDKIQKKYWAQGRESSMGVVQNRNHPRRHRLEIGAAGGLLLGDPYLSVRLAGASAGFHVSELVSLHALYAKAFTGPSSALRALQAKGDTADTNEPREYLGAEGRLNVAYGKIALTGTLLVYLDGSFALSAGRILTRTGAYAVLGTGLGQHFHLGRHFALNLEYRLLAYRENVPNLGSRTNLSHALTLGVSVLFNLGKDTP